MNTRPGRRTAMIGILTATLALLSAAAGQSMPTGAASNNDRAPAHIDPATLDRGPDPRVAFLVRDTIHDGDRRIRVRTPGEHLALFETRSGYLLWNFVFNRSMSVVAVDRDGGKRRLGRGDFVAPLVSPDGSRVAVVVQGRAGSVRKVVRVVNPRTGHVVARRTFPFESSTVAVTDRRVLITNLRRAETEASTWWWNYRRDTVHQISRWRAVDADLRANRVIFDHDWRGTSNCQRVAPLDHPRRTLWRGCRILPHDWNAKGSRALASWQFWDFDHPGTDRWVVLEGRSPDRMGRVTGRLDWNAVWEGNRRFLTIAQSDRGEAAVIRCRLDGRCERASRLWQVPVNEDAYYVAPPLELAENR